MRICLGGVVTLRSTVWRMNYPRAVRAQVTGRIALVGTLVITVVPLVGYAVLDYNPEWFRIIYPVAAAIGGIGIWSFSRVRLRRERELLAYERKQDAAPVPHGAPTPVYEYDPEQTRPGFWSVLRNDPLFRKYLSWQFVIGSANLSCQTITVFLIAEMTRQLPRGFAISVGLTTAIPFLLVALTLPVWTRYLDRVHIVHFRTRHIWFFIAEQATLFVAALLGSLWLVAVARVMQGLARGGAAMAWQLGHNDFASRKMTSVYMGVHVTLTGVRGAIVPFVGMLLYTGWDTIVDPQGNVLLPGFAGLGTRVFLLFLALSAVALLGYIRLDRLMQSPRYADAMAAAPTD